MTNKSLRNVAVAYLVFFVAAIAFERHGFGRGPMSPLDMILAAPIPWGVALYGVKRGSVMGWPSSVDRSKSPIVFGLTVALACLVGLVLFFWGLRDALR